MAAQALYRRWRSQTFAEIIGQEHVTQTLLNALRAGRIAHAYLFAGPRGTGKTSTARVLTKAVNCLDPQNGEPCNRCAICRSLNEGRSLDLIEIDAASNRGIDEIRALREKIAFAPSECRYKVYVIDEVHMLTNEAFNALLKTLEEPPPHAIFVLATTEPHKIPLTVLSRCQRFDFRRVSLSHLKQKLERICAQEGIRIQPAALDAIARYASGSFRDAESLLDQLASYGAEEISLEDVRRVLGTAPGEVISGMIQALVTRDVNTGLRLLNEAL
ncbi:MAG: DNA polymerase III subunit gamma/tau, partial [Chloroflexi bacterium]|nr:DNA polymerase III subunit gamma/tau [Chloroflexota bacterium]